MTFDGRIEAQMTVPASTTLSATNNGGGPTTVTLTAGTYFMSTLVTHLQTVLNAQRAGGGGATWTVSLSTGASATGKVTISMSAGTFDITWSVTNLRNILGFTGNISGATSSTGGSQARGLWIPDCPPNSDIPDHPQAPRMTDRHSTRGPTGIVISHTGNVMYRHPGWRYSHVLRRRVFKGSESTTNESWETFLEDVAWGLGHAWFDGSAYCHVYDVTGAKVGINANSGSGLSGWYLVGPGINSLIPKPVSGQWRGLYRIDGFDLVSNG